jgi:hypothetical protein
LHTMIKQAIRVGLIEATDNAPIPPKVAAI